MPSEQPRHGLSLALAKGKGCPGLQAGRYDWLWDLGPGFRQPLQAPTPKPAFFTENAARHKKTLPWGPGRQPVAALGSPQGAGPSEIAGFPLGPGLRQPLLGPRRSRRFFGENAARRKKTLAWAARQAACRHLLSSEGGSPPCSPWLWQGLRFSLLGTTWVLGHGQGEDQEKLVVPSRLWQAVRQAELPGSQCQGYAEAQESPSRHSSSGGTATGPSKSAQKGPTISPGLPPRTPLLFLNLYY